VDIPTVTKSTDASGVGTEGVVAVLAMNARTRTTPLRDEGDSLIPMVLGFAEHSTLEGGLREVEEAYRMGGEGGQRLGAMLRGLSADTPLDDC
jgi:hypothetical protein